MLPPRVAGGGPPQGQAQGGGQAHQPGLLQQQPAGPRERIRSLADGGADRIHVNPNPDANTKESKYVVFDTLDQELIDLAVYNPSQTETVLQKMRWIYTGQEPFEDFVHRMGSSAWSLAVGHICFKNTLYQSIKPPCALFITDMEPSLDQYIFMDKRQYSECINDRLEPRGARDLIFQQFLERTQKPAEIYLLGVTLVGKRAFLRTLWSSPSVDSIMTF